MALRFKCDDVFEHARSYWTSSERLSFTHRGSRNERYKRGVYKYDLTEASERHTPMAQNPDFKFNKRIPRAAISCTCEDLGDSSYASSSFRVDGGLADAHLTHRLRWRIAYPRDSKGIKSNISAFSFDNHQDFPLRDHIHETSSLALQTIADPTFTASTAAHGASSKQPINTGIASALKSLGDNIKALGADAKEALAEFSDDVKTAANGFWMFKRIGMSIGDFFRNTTSFLRGVVQEPSFTFNDTIPVAAKFNMELSSNSLVAVPGDISMTLGPSFSTTPAPFKVQPPTSEMRGKRVNVFP
ncbi:MAG: hypothetical protein M1840_009036 [Geoglossum simile]|nr:MAG: hypothetical protein M1840_009036 [Geoglossum simile]